MCSCGNINFQQPSVTCLDSTTANVTIVLQSYENVSAQSMVDSVVNYMLELDHPAVVYLQSGWVVCLHADCEWKLGNVTVMDNSTTESDNDESISLVVGLVVGVLLVAIIVALLCGIIIHRKKSRLVQKLDT